MLRCLRDTAEQRLLRAALGLRFALALISVLGVIPFAIATQRVPLTLAVLVARRAPEEAEVADVRRVRPGHWPGEVLQVRVAEGALGRRSL